MIKRFNHLRLLLFIVWGTLISFYYVINFSPPGQKENFVLDDILFGFLFILLCIVLGNRILKLFRLNDISVFEEALFSAGLGAGLAFPFHFPFRPFQPFLSLGLCLSSPDILSFRCS